MEREAAEHSEVGHNGKPQSVGQNGGLSQGENTGREAVVERRVDSQVVGAGWNHKAIAAVGGGDLGVGLAVWGASPNLPTTTGRLQVIEGELGSRQAAMG